MMIASDKPMRNAKETPDPALAMTSAMTLGAAAARNPNPMAPHAPARCIRLMPNRAPSAPAANAAAAMVRIVTTATKLVVLDDNCRPRRTTEMLAATIRPSANTRAAPKPMARVVMVAANPVTCLCTERMLVGIVGRFPGDPGCRE